MQPITSLQPPPSETLKLSAGVILEENGNHLRGKNYEPENQMKIL